MRIPMDISQNPKIWCPNKVSISIKNWELKKGYGSDYIHIVNSDNIKDIVLNDGEWQGKAFGGGRP